MFEVSLLPRGSFEILGFFVCFRVLHYFVCRFGSLPTSIASAPPKKIWIYRNIVISFIHACIAAFLSLYSFFDEPAMLTDMIKTWSSTSFILVSMSTGYFLHDFFDMLVYDARDSIDLLIHHIVVCSAFCIAIFCKMYLGFAVCALLMEVSSVFLHFRRLMCLRGVSKKSLLYQVNGIFLLITFINFRFLTSAWMTNFCIKRHNTLPFSHFLFSVVGMAVMTALNVKLFVALWQADFKSGQTKKVDD